VLKKHTAARISHPVVRFPARTTSPLVKLAHIWGTGLASLITLVTGGQHYYVFGIRGQLDCCTLGVFAFQQACHDVRVRNGSHARETIRLLFVGFHAPTPVFHCVFGLLQFGSVEINRVLHGMQCQRLYLGV
jgi:hypothetical protein